MDEKNKEQKKRIDAAMFSPGGYFTGLLFVCVLESYFTGDIENYFDGMTPIWSELHRFIGGLLAIAFINVLVGLLGMGIYSGIKELFHGEGKIWAIVRAVLSIAVAVLFAGIVFSSCGRFGT